MAHAKDHSEAPRGRDEEVLALIQSSNDLAATAIMNAARANKISEAAISKGSAAAINVAQGAKALAMIGGLFAVVALVIALLVF
jgi:hypothetical protein